MSLPSLSAEEFQLCVRTWCEVVEGEIPGSDLSAAYIRAMRDKESGYALSASDLVQGFRANCESERGAPKIPQDANLLTGDVCKKCHGTNREEYIEHGYKTVRKCDHVVSDLEPIRVTPVSEPDIDEDRDIDSW